MKVFIWKFLLLATLFVFHSFFVFGISDLGKNTKRQSSHCNLISDIISKLIYYQYTQNPELILNSHKRIETKILEYNNSFLSVSYYSLMSEIYQYYTPNDFETINYLNKAINVITKHPSQSDTNPFLFINIGNMLNKADDYYSAIYAYHKAFEISLKNNCDNASLVSLNNIGITFQSIQQYDSAYHYFMV
jgi:tetratricopeptide (TPR) repeat protein